MSGDTRGDSLLTAIVSGCSSAAIAAYLTFPLDFLKTHSQLSNDAQLAKFNAPGFQPTKIAEVMRGSSALALGNVLKNFSRILLYNWTSSFMAIEGSKDKRKTSAPRVVIAGAMSATFETLFIVPTERVKITMIQNQILENEKRWFPDKNIDITGADKHHKLMHNIFSRQYVSPHAYYTSELAGQLKSGKSNLKFHTGQKPKSTIDNLKVVFNESPAVSLFTTIKQMYDLRGILGFYAGTCITFVRQIGTTAAWFSTYNAARQLIDPHNKQQDQDWFRFQHSAWQLIGLHAMSAAAAIAVTQPIDVVKTNIQLKNGKLVYKDSLSAAYKLVLKKGFKSLYAGALPRSIKIAINGGITAFFYSHIEDGINSLATKTIFTD